jgi:hypothetical protein
MKKSTLGQLAILGITSGLITVADGNVGLYADAVSFDTTQMIAKSLCKSGPGGSCASVVAMRDDVKGENAEGRDTEGSETESRDTEEQYRRERADAAADEVYGDDNLVDDRTIQEAVPEWYKEDEIRPATGDGYVKRDPIVPALNKAGRTNARMENLKNRPDRN